MGTGLAEAQNQELKISAAARPAWGREEGGAQRAGRMCEGPRRHGSRGPDPSRGPDSGEWPTARRNAQLAAPGAQRQRDAQTGATALAVDGSRGRRRASAHALRCPPIACTTAGMLYMACVPFGGSSHRATPGTRVAPNRKAGRATARRYYSLHPKLQIISKILEN